MLQSSIPLRPIVRQVMKAAPDRRYSLTALMTQARKLIPDVQANEIADALNWNFSKGYVDNGFNHELDVEVWFLTQRGKEISEE